MRLVILAVMAVSGCVALTPITESTPVALSSGQVGQIQSIVTRDFFDPSSAQFRDVRAVDVVLEDGTRERRVCGEVNGKNRLGGYVGFSGFGGVLEDGRFVKRDFFSSCEAW